MSPLSGRSLPRLIFGLARRDGGDGGGFPWCGVDILFAVFFIASSRNPLENCDTRNSAMCLSLSRPSNFEREAATNLSSRTGGTVVMIQRPCPTSGPRASPDMDVTPGPTPKTPSQPDIVMGIAFFSADRNLDFGICTLFPDPQVARFPTFSFFPTHQVHVNTRRRAPSR